jgi:hypothetical protein
MHGQLTVSATVAGQAGAMEPFAPGSFSNFKSVSLSTRHFTSRREDPFSTAVRFSPLVDPKGIMASMSTDDYFHGVISRNSDPNYNIFRSSEPEL